MNGEPEWEPTLHPLELLEKAARLIEGYAKTLSRQFTVCAHCNRASYTNYPEHQEEAELQRIVIKLRKISATKGTTNGCR